MSETKEITEILTNELPVQADVDAAAELKPAVEKTSVPAKKAKAVKKKANVKPAVAANAPNIRFIGEKGREQSSMQGSDRHALWTISQSINQSKPFFHKDAARIVHSLPHLYANIGADTKNKISKGGK